MISACSAPEVLPVLGGWRAWRRWSWLQIPLSASGRWRWTCSSACPACLRILCGDILARKAAGCLVLTKHCRVSVYCSLHLFVPRKLDSTRCFYSSRTLARGLIMRYFVSSIVEGEKPSLPILAIFNARRMSDCSSCTRPPCLAIVAVMLKTCKTSVDGSNNEIRLLPLPYTLL